MNRRSMFGTLAAVAVLPALSPVVAAAVLEPDAVLIALCRDYIAAIDACDRNGGLLESEVDPLWLHLKQLEAAVEDIEPVTMAGVVALAGVAHRWALQPDGCHDYSTSYTGDWPERVVRAVAEIAGARA